MLTQKDSKYKKPKNTLHGLNEDGSYTNSGNFSQTCDQSNFNEDTYNNSQTSIGYNNSSFGYNNRLFGYVNSSIGYNNTKPSIGHPNDIEDIIS